MIKPKRLCTGDKIAIVSLSWGGLGDEYKDSITQVVVNEEHLNDLPIFYNVNFGHAKPIGVIPYGIMAELNCKNKTIVFLECPTG